MPGLVYWSRMTVLIRYAEREPAITARSPLGQKIKEIYRGMQALCHHPPVPGMGIRESPVAGLSWVPGRKPRRHWSLRLQRCL